MKYFYLVLSFLILPNLLGAQDSKEDYEALFLALSDAIWTTPPEATLGGQRYNPIFVFTALGKTTLDVKTYRKAPGTEEYRLTNSGSRYWDEETKNMHFIEHSIDGNTTKGICRLEENVFYLEYSYEVKGEKVVMRDMFKLLDDGLISYSIVDVTDSLEPITYLVTVLEKAGKEFP